MEDIDELLDKYDPGKPNMKPDVLKQIAEIEAKREQMMREYQQQQLYAPIMLTQEGKPPIQLTSNQIVQIITQNKEQIDGLIKKTEEQQRYIQLLQNKLIQQTKQNKNTVTDKHKISDVTDTQISDNSEKDQLIAQIKILTQRNGILESRLTTSQTANGEMMKQIEKLSNDFIQMKHNATSNIHTNMISKSTPEVMVVIDNDE